jgi:IclR family transcriptional regulator, pca regulon regulatory protein
MGSMKQRSYQPTKKQRRRPAPSTRKTPSIERVPPRPDTPADNPKNVVNSVSKAFKVLQAFDADRQELNVSEVAGATNLDRGTAFRLIHTFVSLGYLRQVPIRRYRLTLKCLELGFLALSDRDLRSHARPMLQECVPDVVDAASLGTLDGPDAVFLERIDTGLSRHNLDRRAGRRIRAYGAALGHCMLAFLPEAQQVSILESAERVKLSEKTLVDLNSLLVRLRQVRTNGYAVSDGENAYGLRTVAAPVLDPDGYPVAGVSLTVDAERMSIDALVKIAVPKVLGIASELSRALRLSAGSIRIDPSK